MASYSSSSSSSLAQMQFNSIFNMVSVKLDGPNYLLWRVRVSSPCVAYASLAMSMAHSHAHWNISLLSRQLMLQPMMICHHHPWSLKPEYILWHEHDEMIIGWVFLLLQRTFLNKWLGVWHLNRYSWYFKLCLLPLHEHRFMILN